MSNTQTNTTTNTYSESRARYVMGKIFDDFHAISYRGFEELDDSPERLPKIREDLFYLMTNKVLISFQVQFCAKDGREWAIEYTIKADGSVHEDSDSGGVNYYEIPADVRINFPTKWTKGTKRIDDHMIERGWTAKGKYIEGDLINDGAYSKNGYGATKGRKGAWNH